MAAAQRARLAAGAAALGLSVAVVVVLVAALARGTATGPTAPRPPAAARAARPRPARVNTGARSGFCRPAGVLADPVAARAHRARACAAGLRVAGTELLDGAGHRVRLRGVVRSGAEYMCSEGYGIFDGPSGRAEFAPMRAWGIDTVYIGLNEDCWLGINGVPPADAGPNYIAAIRHEVSAAEAAGLYPVVGFFWGDPGGELPHGEDPNGGGQPPLPDADHAPLFFEQLARTFRADPSVVYRLQEEPHPDGGSTDLEAWQCWSQGDVQYRPDSDRPQWDLAPRPVSERPHCSEKGTDDTTAYRTVGMQSLVDIIRGTGARNVIQVPGLAYANMLSCAPVMAASLCGFLDGADGIRVHDTLHPAQLMADVDVYPDSGQDCSAPSCYDTTYGPVADVMPLDAGEVGPNGSMDSATTRFLDWMDARGASYYAWAWDTWGSLVSSYAGTPDAVWGAAFRARVSGQQATGPAQPADGITIRQVVPAPCANPPTTAISLPGAIAAGDELLLVVAGAGYTGPASTAGRVSDPLNGAWTQLVNTRSQSSGPEAVAYAVYELPRARTAPGGLTVTLTGHWGQSGMSAELIDLGGVAATVATRFDARLQAQSTDLRSPAVSGAAGDLVLGLFGAYSHASDTYGTTGGWRTSLSAWTATGNCAAAAIDWRRAPSAGPVSAAMSVNPAEYHYGGTIVLRPRAAAS